MDDATGTFPPATGLRMQWSQLPRAVRVAIEAAIGQPVVAAVSQPGGFSPGVAARMSLADGSRVFCKVVGPDPNPDSPAIHRREVGIARGLPVSAPVPRLRADYDDGDWVALVFDDIDGRLPQTPWEPSELTRVLLAMYEMSVALSPSPIATDPASVRLADAFHGWQSIADDAALTAQLPEPISARLDALLALETQWPVAVAGDSLLHLDLRADNVLLTTDRVYFVDWPWAAIGAAWVDLVVMLPSIAMQGGPDPEDVFAAHPLARHADPDAVDAVIAALTGMFVWQSLLAAPPGLPTVRPFQAHQGAHAFAWLSARRNW